MDARARTLFQGGLSKSKVDFHEGLAMTRNVYGTPRLFPLLFLVFFAFISSAAQAQVADLVRSALGTQLNGVREKDVPRLEPNPPNVLIAYTALPTNRAGGRHANVRTMRPVVVKDDGTGR